MSKETVVAEKPSESPWSAYHRAVTKFNVFLTPTAKMISSNMGHLTGHPHGTSNWDRMGVDEKQPFLDLAEKLMVSLKVQMPKRPMQPKQ